ncbi:uncharacterized protein LOC113523240 [Galleria mellonella]|uniref:Uncharacterized protein LOC113523240 n=1 Tax=Galleria mellonella TaxID=7137 RepID=A0A6J1X4Z8_GALME|nr:uncharacterized protein LOC113523240 [Galleria mellonella]
MTVIAVQGVPKKWDLKGLVKVLAKVVRGQFQAINFQPSTRRQQCKVAYLKLAKYLNAAQVVNVINRHDFKKANLSAFIPDHVPDLPMSTKRKDVTKKTMRKKKTLDTIEPTLVLSTTHNELLSELQFKFTGLLELSEKSKHKLLTDIARIILERLKQISDSDSTAVSQGGFHLSKLYRKMHPHTGDFQMIMSTLHTIEDAEGVPRSQIQENELISVHAEPKIIDNVPMDKVHSIGSRYTDKITRKVNDHIKGLEIEDATGASEEVIARRKVRLELKNIAMYIPMIIKQTITDNLNLSANKYQRVRVYGEPYLPLQDQLSPVLRRFKANKIHRSDRLYNILRFVVPITQFPRLVTLMDGKVLGGGKLIIRSSDTPVFKVSENFITEMKENYGIEYSQEEEKIDDDVNPDNDGQDQPEEGQENAEQNWDEPWE